MIRSVPERAELDLLASVVRAEREARETLADRRRQLRVQPRVGARERHQPEELLQLGGLVDVLASQYIKQAVAGPWTWMSSWGSKPCGEAPIPFVECVELL